MSNSDPKPENNTSNAKNSEQVNTDTPAQNTAIDAKFMDEALA